MATSWTFYGRTDELGSLLACLRQRRWFFGTIRGRRRVGKTALVQQALRILEEDEPTEVPCLLVQLPDSTPADLATVFRNAVREAGLEGHLDESSADPGLPGVARAVGSLCSAGVVVILDEFQTCHGGPLRGLPSLLQAEVDGLQDLDTAGGLILLGSVQTEMEALLNDRRAPLFGRTTFDISLDPWDLATVFEVCREQGAADPARCLTLWALFGGVPKYWRHYAEQGADLHGIPEWEPWAQQVCEGLFLRSDSPLREEGESLLGRELRRHYVALLRADRRARALHSCRTAGVRARALPGTVPQDARTGTSAGRETGPHLRRTPAPCPVRRFRPVSTRMAEGHSPRLPGRPNRAGVQSGQASDCAAENPRRVRLRTNGAGGDRGGVSGGCRLPSLGSRQRATGTGRGGPTCRSRSTSSRGTRRIESSVSARANEMRQGTMHRRSTDFREQVDLFLDSDPGSRFRRWRREFALYSVRFSPEQRADLEAGDYVCHDMIDFQSMLVPRERGPHGARSASPKVSGDRVMEQERLPIENGNWGGASLCCRSRGPGVRVRGPRPGFRQASGCTSSGHLVERGASSFLRLQTIPDENQRSGHILVSIRVPVFSRAVSCHDQFRPPQGTQAQLVRRELVRAGVAVRAAPACGSLEGASAALPFSRPKRSHRTSGPMPRRSSEGMCNPGMAVSEPGWLAIWRDWKRIRSSVSSTAPWPSPCWVGFSRTLRYGATVAG